MFGLNLCRKERGGDKCGKNTDFFFRGLFVIRRLNLSVVLNISSLLGIIK